MGSNNKNEAPQINDAITTKISTWTKKIKWMKLIIRRECFTWMKTIHFTIVILILGPNNVHIKTSFKF